ncbi:hypothetical protein CAPTEDRAFT_194530 [Capitella teleta]|uniref:G-protein coupled receptors family 1 profile domain-containing protein n=1 Tax=Capitella teleta TaxID=283909 RepID=R7THT3_CAPTE|nr:hypothetical protein CAPTEDRAFT_194530 [Capitella teleta]|eukprot:ELT93037.1 hypothetical protein CAPTEDRAFT_194530 [Capitella teleta]
METTQVTPAAKSGVSTDIYDTIYCFKLVIGLAILVSNSFLLLLVYKTPHLSSISTRIVVSLSVADLLFGLSSLLDGALVLSRYTGTSRTRGAANNQYRLSLAMTVCQEWTVFVSSMHTLVIGIDRCVAVMLPLRYQALVTEFRRDATLVVTWLTPLVLVVPFLFVKESLVTFEVRLFIKVALYVAIASCMLTIYTKIGVAALEQRRRIQAAEQNAPPERVSRLTLVLGAVLGSYLLLWLPAIVGILGIIYFYQIPRLPPAGWLLTVYWTPLLGMLNSVANVVIYSLMNSKYRRAMVAICCGGDQDVPAGSSHP